MSKQEYGQRIASVRAKMNSLVSTGRGLRFLILTPATPENVTIVAKHQEVAAFVNCELCAYACFISDEAQTVLDGGAIVVCSGCFDVLKGAGAFNGPHVRSIDCAVLASNLNTQLN